jgi:Uma2 family endonuclease
MSPHLPKGLQEFVYEREAQAYLRSLPPEHFMEATDQGTQRAITLASLALVRGRRRDVHVFNELLVQYPRRGQRKLGQVVPDNMLVLTEAPIQASSSYNVPLEPAPPFIVFEYVSKSNPRKDYEDSFRKYERELKVPYYAIFYPETQDLTLYRHNRRRYVTVKPNKDGRYPIPELELELGILDEWMRFWYQGELLPLPADLQNELDKARRQAGEEKRRADEEKQRADEARRQADEEKQRADKEKQRVEEETQRADELQRRLETVERELAELRAHRNKK